MADEELSLSHLKLSKAGGDASTQSLNADCWRVVFSLLPHSELSSVVATRHSEWWRLIRDDGKLRARWEREKHERRLLVRAKGRGYIGYFASEEPSHAKDLGTTLVDAAAAGGLLDVKFLHSQGADLHFLSKKSDPPKSNALMQAAQNGRVEVLRFLIDAGAGDGIPGSIMEGKGIFLDDALWCAVRHNEIDAAKLLFERKSRYDYDSLLVSAAGRGYLELTQLLLDHGADVHAYEDRALTLAREEGHTAVLALLQSRG